MPSKNLPRAFTILITLVSLTFYQRLFVRRLHEELDGVIILFQVFSAGSSHTAHGNVYGLNFNAHISRANGEDRPPLHTTTMLLRGHETPRLGYLAISPQSCPRDVQPRAE